MFLLQFMRNVSWRHRILYTLYFPSWIPPWTESKNMNTHAWYIWGRGGKRLQIKRLQVRCNVGWSRGSRKWTYAWENTSNIIRKHQRFLLQYLVLLHQCKDSSVDSSDASLPYIYTLNGCIFKTATFFCLFLWPRPVLHKIVLILNTDEPL